MDIKIDRVEDIIVIKPQGEIDLHSSPQLRAILQDNIKDATLGVLIDLGRVNYMDSSGLATLAEAFQVIKKEGKKMAICALTDTVKNILSITRLDEIFPVFGSQEEALKELKLK